MRAKYFTAFIVILFLSSPAGAVSLDDIAGPLVPHHQFLYSLDLGYYHQQERGMHGSSSFGEFNSEPEYFTVGNKLRFAPIENTELGVGLATSFSPVYQRFTYDETTPVLDFLNDYRVDQFHEFEFDVRHRRGSYEYFLDSYGNNQRSGWHSAPGFSEGNFFTHITSHYEDITAGARFADQKKALEASIRYRSGRLERTNNFFGTMPPVRRNYFHELRKHVTPEVLLQYDIRDDITVRSGLAYTTPYKYKFEFQQFNPAGTSNFISATYSMSEQIFLPLGVQYRRDVWTFDFSSDFTVASQRLDAHEKEISNLTTILETKKLKYYNIKPTLKIEYFYDAQKEEKESVFEDLTKEMLQKNQYKLSFKVEKDKSSVNKNATNGFQNIIDPYNVFENPSLDNFMAGTEAAAFLAGNSSSSFSNVKPQDYTNIEIGLKYGITDHFNSALIAEYHTGSTVHQTVFDRNISNRMYVFEPYYSLQWITDWQFKETNLLSLDLYYVPKYKTFLWSDLDAQEYEVENEYLRANFKFTKLF